MLETLQRLPEWCVYLETPGLSYGNTPLSGVWAWLDDSDLTGGDYLYLGMDRGTPSSATLEVVQVAIGRSLEHAFEELWASLQKPQYASIQPHRKMIRQMFLGNVGQLLPLLMFLCTTSAIVGPDGKPQIPVSARELTSTAVDKPTIWSVAANR